MAHHAGFGFSGGYVGVDVFFVISGYVITRMLAAEMATNGRIDLAHFYLRRARRLLPALAAMLTVALLLSALFTPLATHRSIARTGISAALFNANNYLALFGVTGGYFDVGSQANSLLHTWSLAVEEQFYFVVPALLMLAWGFGGRSGRRHLATWLLGVLIAGSFGLSLVLEFGVGQRSDRALDLAFYASPARAWEFAVGGVVALAAGRTSTLRGSAASAGVLAGAVMVGASMLVFDETTRFPGVAVLVPVLGTALMIAGGEPTQVGIIGRWLSTRPMQRIGDLSYSWYLWHWPLIVFAAALLPKAGAARPLAAAVGLALAAGSYRWIENPVRHRTATPRRTIALAGVCIVAPLAAGMVLEVATQRLRTVPVMAAFDTHIDVSEGCDGEVPLRDRDPETCRWTVPQPEGVVALVGDSTAGQFSEAVLGAAGSVGLETLLVTNSSCPFVPLQLWEDGERDRACEEFVTGTTQALIELQPDVVVIASASDGYLRGARWQVAEPNGERLGDPDAKAAAWERGLESLLTDLRAAGIEVVLVQPTPKFTEWNPWKMATARLIGPWAQVDIEFDRETALERRRRAVDVGSAAAAASGATVLDVFDDVCQSDPCSTTGPGFWRYRDSGHISVGQSERLVGPFEEVLIELVDRP